MSSNNNDQDEKITIKKLTKEEQKLIGCTDKELLEYYDYTVKWLQTQVKNAGASGVVLGISGGVDSALVSKIAADAFPGRSIGVSINLNSFPNFQKHSREVILFTGIKHISLSISDIYSSLWQKIDSVTTLKSNELAKANVKPRMRMTVLYYIASKYKYLVVGTDNADELYLGYFTKYGDGGVDLLPIAKLNKAQVRRLTRLKGFP
ncbi:MAG: NAD(+) synthase, partial [Mycoplasmataceae bacterium]|nr:NAD(+) synthase [Mycoplasmataceae bacterium]